MSAVKERSPRAVEHLDVDIKIFADKHLFVPTLNVSIGGFAIQCSMEERSQLTPLGDIVDDIDPVDVNLQLYNQLGEQECVRARCRVVYSRRIAEDKCQIGMSYIGLSDDAEGKLLVFINDVLKER